MVEDEIKLVPPEDTGMEEIGLEGFGGQFLKNPEVEKEIEFTIADMYKNHKDLVGVKDGKTYSRALSKSDPPFNVVVKTIDGETLTLGYWEQVNKIQAARVKFNAKSGVSIKLKHVLDGMAQANRGKEAYQVLAKYGNSDWTEIVLPKKKEVKK